MRKRLWRVVVLVVLLAVNVLLLSGCFMWPWETFDEGSYTYFSDSRESVSEGYFRLTIHTEKDTFTEGETIDCWAELEYIGDEDSITVYVYGAPVEMSMTGEDVTYDNSSLIYVSDEETLTLYKGMPVRCTLAEYLPKSSSVLPGRYEIDAWAYLALSPDGNVSYNAYVSAVIEVEEKD